MTLPSRTLYYVADPMCSWCWGFQAELEVLREGLPADVAIEYVMGGLAPDSSEPMPAETRAYIQEAWRAVEQRTGAAFNWDFWERCEPRRSTYPACRAVVAAGLLGPGLERKMFEAIQRAYYLEARNPSLPETLLELAVELDLDGTSFAQALTSDATAQAFRKQLDTCQRLNTRSFPSMVLEQADGTLHTLLRGAGSAAQVLAGLQASAR